MIPPTKTQAIKRFLLASTSNDLAEMYNKDMECQVNVAQDGGTRITGEYRGHLWHGYTDGMQTWKPFRIPYNANVNPEYTDTAMRFSLEDHAEAIGMTGWDWAKKLSRWVAYDFDAITGHSPKHVKKLTTEELDRIKADLQEIPWVTLRSSSGGKGLHVYVFLEPVLTMNHCEHAALARAILGKMSAIVGCDFEAQVDVCGGNMWVWHRKAKSLDGLKLIKRGNSLGEVPPYWKDHIKVVTGHRKRMLPTFLKDSEGSSEVEESFNEVVSQATRIQLDEEHKKLIKWLEDKATKSWWDLDHHMLISHTFHLKQAHEELHMRGRFDTNAEGTEAPGDCNCYMFPLVRGGWSVRRYTRGVAEHSSWDQDGRGWTRTFFNTDPDLPMACRTNGGIEATSGEFVFSEAELAAETARLLGAVVPAIPSTLRAEKARLKSHRDGRLVMVIEGDKKGMTADSMQGWLHDKGKWSRIFNMKPNPSPEGEIVSNFDHQIRHMISEGREDAGWAIKRGEDWDSEPLIHIMRALEALGVSAKDVKIIIGSAVMKCWCLVNQPFQPEYPGERLWNKDAAQFTVAPSQQDDLNYPTWLMILNHIGLGLDDAIKENPWARANGISTGADYLKLWIASVFKEPTEPLPYLFLFGNQNSGKSILHEALALLVTKGCQRAEAALINQSAFNAELASAIICIVEELNLRVEKVASNRIKDWVTALELPIHPKGKTPYHIKNSTHWIQTANNPQFCPIFPGDTRITMISVPDLDPITRIPKKDILIRLKREAPDFLAEILRLEIPPSNDRLNVPVISTAEKVDIERQNRTLVEAFLAEKCFYVPGKKILYGELYDRFFEWADPIEVQGYSKMKFGRELPPQFPKGRSREDSKYYIGNIDFERPNGQTLLKLKATPPDEHGNIFLVMYDDSGNIK